ncbi:SLOG family protein [Streptomyces sp. 8N706]|uniref:SLOG family protein n=1 Tax=Streptomyces sp. 8N706 TaxID=3457416 RepID=UPI003FD55759
MNPPPSRVLICGSRQWPWPDTVTNVLDRLAAHHPDDLVIIETAATGAERAAHRWCQTNALPAWRHRCHPTPRHRRMPPAWQTGPQRHQRILHDEEPRLVIVFHEDLAHAHGATADLCRLAIDAGIPLWHIPTSDPQLGRWLGAHPHTRDSQPEQDRTPTDESKPSAADA